MNYKGVIIEESLKNKSVLSNIKIIETKVEKVTEYHQTPWLTQWTLDTVEIPEEKMDATAEEVARNINSEPISWYADFKNDTFHYIIFPDKTFKVTLANPIMYKDAKQYGISLGIPPYQVDFAPDDKVWER